MGKRDFVRICGVLRGPYSEKLTWRPKNSFSRTIVVGVLGKGDHA